MHGTNNAGIGAFKGILDSRTIIQGITNAYGGSKPTNRNDPIPSKTFVFFNFPHTVEMRK